MAGPFEDLSSDFHRLIQIFAESRAASISRLQGFDGGDGLLGRVTGQIRWVFLTTIVRANAKCLLDRLAQLGNGTVSAAKRRQTGIQKTPGSRGAGTHMGFERMLEAGESLRVMQLAGFKLTTMLISSTSCTSLRICINIWRPPLLLSVCTFLQSTVS